MTEVGVRGGWWQEVVSAHRPTVVVFRFCKVKISFLFGPNTKLT